MEKYDGGNDHFSQIATCTDDPLQRNNKDVKKMMYSLSFSYAFRWIWQSLSPSCLSISIIWLGYHRNNPLKGVLKYTSVCSELLQWKEGNSNYEDITVYVLFRRVHVAFDFHIFIMPTVEYDKII